MRCAVLGDPIDHSLSPFIHRAAYRELGLEGDATAGYAPGDPSIAPVPGAGVSIGGLSSPPLWVMR